MARTSKKCPPSEGEVRIRLRSAALLENSCTEVRLTLFWRKMASNFQYAGSAALVELAVAAAIAVFGLESGVVATGVLVEVPVMLSVVRTVLRTRGWYQAWRRDTGRVRTRRRHLCQCRRDSARGSLARATKRGRKADSAANGGWISEPRSAVLSGVPDRTPRSEIFHASGLWDRDLSL